MVGNTESRHGRKHPGRAKAGYRSLTRRTHDALRKFYPLLAVKRTLFPNEDGKRGTTKINILRSFPLFIPYSDGSYKDRASFTVQAINETFSRLAQLAESVGHDHVPIEPISAAAKTEADKAAAEELKLILDRSGSDKARNDYHHLYGAILANRRQVRRIFEIGLGTNNTDVVSHMTHEGTPGASLRAFRDFCPNAHIWGADVDRRVLFEEDRITTRFIDQTNPATVDALLNELPSAFDLVIDDGLHSPHANIESLRFGLRLVRPGGWVVIEDIGSPALPLWQTVSALLPDMYRARIFDAQGRIIYVVRRAP